MEDMTLMEKSGNIHSALLFFSFGCQQLPITTREPYFGRKENTILVFIHLYACVSLMKHKVCPSDQSRMILGVFLLG
uniref:Uncharacterized protein n=1 Tax=Triticum urartu TaxID=4572 RepID=A0A8R7TPI7_TRIUA